MIFHGKIYQDYKVIFKQVDGKEYVAYFDREIDAVEAVQRHAASSKSIDVFYHDGTKILYIEDGIICYSAISVREGQHIINNPIIFFPEK